MKPLQRNILYGVLICLMLAGIVVAFIYAGKTTNALVGALKSKAKEQYLSAQYKEAALTNRTLLDSFKIDEDAIRLNFANAAYLHSELDSTATRKNNGYEGIKADSSNLKNLDRSLSFLATSQQEYLTLTKAKHKVLASMANNQLGILSLKENGAFIDEGTNSPDKIDSLLRQSIVLFQEALRKDPDNDSARYNYELLMKKLDFPAAVYAHAEQLVKQRRYRDAYQLMTNAIKRDARMKKYEEFTQKVFAVYKIDSLKRS